MDAGISAISFSMMPRERKVVSQVTIVKGCYKRRSPCGANNCSMPRLSNVLPPTGVPVARPQKNGPRATPPARFVPVTQRLQLFLGFEARREATFLNASTFAAFAMKAPS
jgi:hypothetical protein